MNHNPLVLAIKDLWLFVNDEVRYCLQAPEKIELLHKQQPQLFVASAKSPLLLSPFQSAVTEKNLTLEELLDSTYQPFLDYPEYEFDVLNESEIKVDEAEMVLPPEYYSTEDPAVMYVVVKEAVCVARPQKDFDTMIAKFPYATAVTVTGYQGNYAKVFWSHHEGWIQKDDLTPYKSQVWPYFANGNVYEADSDSGKKLRLLIGDIFYVSDLNLPLQAGEWVVLRLREENRLIPWTVSHGRIPGDWQILLKGAPGVHIGIVPKTGSIMEWRGDDAIGRVAYVEKIDSDQNITFTIAGYEEPGCFEERTLTPDEWRELRPVFIEVL